MSDPGLQTLARADFNRDGAITYSDMLGLFNQAEAEVAGGTLSTAQFQSLQVLVTNAGTLNMPGYVSNLASKVVNGDPANTAYHYLNSAGNVQTVARKGRDSPSGLPKPQS